MKTYRSETQNLKVIFEEKDSLIDEQIEDAITLHNCIDDDSFFFECFGKIRRIPDYIYNALLSIADKNNTINWKMSYELFYDLFFNNFGTRAYFKNEHLKESQVSIVINSEMFCTESVLKLQTTKSPD